MRRWGVVVTLFYAAAVLLLIVPMAVVMIGEWKVAADIHREVRDVYHYWLTWVFAAVFILGQALLLFLSVDTSDRRLKPRTRIAFSIASAGLLLAVLTFAAVSSIAVAIRGDSADSLFWPVLIGGLFAPWLLWALAFYWYSRKTEDVVGRAVSWLIRGSVLELLIAVPSHVIVRRRDDCCAPVVTGFGIASGIAVMLLSFGPSVVFLYQRRMQSLKTRRALAAKA